MALTASLKYLPIVSELSDLEHAQHFCGPFCLFSLSPRRAFGMRSQVGSKAVIWKIHLFIYFWVMFWVDLYIFLNISSQDCNK